MRVPQRCHISRDLSQNPRWLLLYIALLFGYCFLASIAGCAKSGVSSREPLLPPSLEILTPSTPDRADTSIEISSITIVDGGDLILSFPDDTTRRYRITESELPNHIVDVLVMDSQQNELRALPPSSQQEKFYLSPQTPEPHDSEAGQHLLMNECIRLFGTVYCPVADPSQGK